MPMALLPLKPPPPAPPSWWVAGRCARVLDTPQQTATNGGRGAPSPEARRPGHEQGRTPSGAPGWSPPTSPSCGGSQAALAVVTSPRSQSPFSRGLSSLRLHPSCLLWRHLSLD